MNLKTCLAPILALLAISTLSMAATIPLLNPGDAQLSSITNPTLLTTLKPAFDTTLDHTQNNIQNNHGDALYAHSRLYRDGLSDLKMEEAKGGDTADRPIKDPYDSHYDKFYQDHPSMKARILAGLSKLKMGEGKGGMTDDTPIRDPHDPFHDTIYHKLHPDLFSIKVRNRARLGKLKVDEEKGSMTDDILIKDPYDLDYDKSYPDHPSLKSGNLAGLSNLKMEEVKGGDTADIAIKDPHNSHHDDIHDKFHAELPSIKARNRIEVQNPKPISENSSQSKDNNEIKYNAGNIRNRIIVFKRLDEKWSSMLETISEFEKQIQNKPLLNDEALVGWRKDLTKILIFEQRQKMIDDEMNRLKTLKWEVKDRMREKRSFKTDINGDVSTVWIDSELRLIKTLAREVNRLINQIKQIPKERDYYIWRKFIAYREMVDAMQKDEDDLAKLSKAGRVARINAKRRARAEKNGLPFKRYEG